MSRFYITNESRKEKENRIKMYCHNSVKILMKKKKRV